MALKQTARGEGVAKHSYPPTSAALHCTDRLRTTERVVSICHNRP